MKHGKLTAQEGISRLFNKASAQDDGAFSLRCLDNCRTFRWLKARRAEEVNEALNQSNRKNT